MIQLLDTANFPNGSSVFRTQLQQMESNTSMCTVGNQNNFA